MKTAFSILFTLGTGVIGLIIGGGLGFVGAGVTVMPDATAAGACWTVDAALRSGILTTEKARQLGTDTAKANVGIAELLNGRNISVADQGAACQQFLQGLTTN